MEGFCDAHKVTDKDEVISSIVFVFTLGTGAISWKSSKHTCISRSTIKSEFITLELACEEAEWLRKLLAGIPLWGRQALLVSFHYDS